MNNTSGLVDIKTTELNINRTIRNIGGLSQKKVLKVRFQMETRLSKVVRKPYALKNRYLHSRPKNIRQKLLILAGRGTRKSVQCSNCKRFFFVDLNK